MFEDKKSSSWGGGWCPFRVPSKTTASLSPELPKDPPTPLPHKQTASQAPHCILGQSNTPPYMTPPLGRPGPPWGVVSGGGVIFQRKKPSAPSAPNWSLQGVQGPGGHLGGGSYRGGVLHAQLGHHSHGVHHRLLQTITSCIKKRARLSDKH